MFVLSACVFELRRKEHNCYDYSKVSTTLIRMSSYATAVFSGAICRGAGKWSFVHFQQLNLPDAASELSRRLYKLYLLLLHTCTDEAAQVPRRYLDGNKMCT
jgi:hypothetical protein